jgi:hypothetical protein
MLNARCKDAPSGGSGRSDRLMRVMGSALISSQAARGPLPNLSLPVEVLHATAGSNLPHAARRVSMRVVAVADPNHLLEGCQRKSLVPVWQERRAVYVLIRRGHARFITAPARLLPAFGLSLCTRFRNDPERPFNLRESSGLNHHNRGKSVAEQLDESAGTSIPSRRFFQRPLLGREVIQCVILSS